MVVSCMENILSNIQPISLCLVHVTNDGTWNIVCRFQFLVHFTNDGTWNIVCRFQFLKHSLELIFFFFFFWARPLIFFKKKVNGFYENFKKFMKK